MIRLWEFQNGKMGLYSPKIDWDTAKNVKNENFEKGQLSLRKTQFSNKNWNFSIWIFAFFAVSQSIFEL